MDTNAIVTGIALINLSIIFVIPLVYYLAATGMRRGDRTEEGSSSAGYRSIPG